MKFGKFEKPWGFYEVISDNNDHKIKRIVVDQNSSLSLQSHQSRDETWVIIQGIASATVGNEDFVLTPGENIFVPRLTRHRIRNISNEPLVFIEIQLGDYFGEDDIERYEDEYGRC